MSVRLVSVCCEAEPVDEITDGAGRCSQCKEGATFEADEEQVHTPTPWWIGGRDGRAWTITDERSTHAAFPVILSRKNGGRICNVDSREEENCNANARRIVAAVNGCEGIPTDALEAGVMADLLEALERLLIPPLSPIVECPADISSQPCVCGLHDAQIAASSAIAKAKAS